MNSYPTSDGQDRCETCEHYQFIDSGYGYCVKNPPHLHLTPNKKWGVFMNYKMDISYPSVPWNMKSCSYHNPAPQTESLLYEEKGAGYANPLGIQKT